MKTLLLFILYVIVFVNGCKENPTKDLSTQDQKIKRITQSNDYTEFIYEKGLLIQKNDSWHISFTYDEKNRLIAKDVISTIIPGLYIANSAYEYSDINLIQREDITKNENLLRYVLYEYEKDKIMKYSSYSPDGELMEYHILKYEDSNIIENAYYDNRDSLLSVETYIYDNKRNPLNVDVSPIQASSYSRNNITYSVEVQYLSIPHGIITTVNTYTYNEYDYPEKCFTERTAVDKDGLLYHDTSTMFYEYFE